MLTVWYYFDMVGDAMGVHLYLYSARALLGMLHDTHSIGFDVLEHTT